MAGPIAALAGAKALSAAHAAGPAMQSARDSAVPVVTRAAEKAKEVLPV